MGVDLGQSHLLVLAVDKRAEKPEITNLRIESRPPASEGVSSRLREIFKEEGLDPKRVRVVMKSQGVVIRILTFPQMKRSDLANVLRYEVEKYIPFKSSDVILDFQVLEENMQKGSGARMMEILLVAVKQAEVYQLLRLLQGADLEVELIDTSAFAFVNALEFLTSGSEKQTIAFLDMGAETSTFGITRRGKPVFIRDISFGGTDIFKLLKRKLELDPEAVLALQRDPGRLPSEYRGVVEQALSSFVNEVKLSLGYYWDHISGAEPIQTLFVAGGGLRLVPDVGFLGQEIKIPTRRPELLPRIQVRPQIDDALLRKNEDLLPVALGLCLR